MTNLKNKKLVVFDFDGTLVDSMETFADIAARVIHEVFGTPVSEARAQYIKTSGLPFFQQVAELYPNNKNNAHAVERFEKEKLNGYFEQKVYEDAADTMSYFAMNGIITAVSSNNFQHLVDEFLQKKHIQLDYALGFLRDDFCKGATHFQHLLNETGLAKEEMLFVGDSLKDAEKAKHFGIDFCGKTGLFTKDQFLKAFSGIQVIDDLADLKKMIG